MKLNRSSLLYGLFVVMLIAIVAMTAMPVLAQDSDGDGYDDVEDFCPEEGDFGFGVDEIGCPIFDEQPQDVDSDGDGFMDSEDSCPFESDQGLGLDPFGCPIQDVDSDGDGFMDSQDSCPFEGDEGSGIDAFGCPFTDQSQDETDSDFDGYIDSIDLCPFEGDAGFGLDGNGCPFANQAENDAADTDGDGIADIVDACMFEGDDGFGVDANGCPFDADGNSDGSDTPDENLPNPFGLSYDLTCDGDQPLLIVSSTEGLPAETVGFTYESATQTNSGTFPAIEPGGSLEPIRENEDFAFYVDGLLVAQVGVDDCINGTITDTDGEIGTLTGLNLSYNLSCVESSVSSGNDVSFMFINEGVPIDEGTVQIFFTNMDGDQTPPQFLPSLDTGETSSPEIFSENFNAYVNGVLFASVNVALCDEEASGGMDLVAEAQQGLPGNILDATTFDGEFSFSAPFEDGTTVYIGTSGVAVNPSIEVSVNGNVIVSSNNGRAVFEADGSEYDFVIRSVDGGTGGIAVNTSGEGAAPTGGEAVAGDLNISPGLACTADGAVVSLTNNGDPIADDTVVVELQSFDGGSIADTLPALDSGESIDLPAIDENFAVLVNGEQIASVDIELDCGDETAIGDLDISPDLECTVDGAIVSLINYGDPITGADNVAVEIQAADGSSVADTLPDLGNGESIDLPPIDEDFAVFVDGAQIFVVDYEVDCGGEAAAGDVSISPGLTCTPDGAIVSLTNNGDPIAESDNVAVEIQADDGTSIADTLPDFDTNETIELPPIDEDFAVFIEGEQVAVVDYEIDCGEAVAGDVSISPGLTCTPDGAIVSLTNNGDPIADADNVVVEIQADDGTSIADTLPDFDTNETIELPPIDEDFAVFIEGEQVAVVDYEIDCGEATAGEVAISPGLTCTPDGAIVSLTNNGDPIAESDNVAVEIQADDGTSIADTLPDFDTNETIELPPIDEDFAVFIEGEQVAIVDYEVDCGGAGGGNAGPPLPTPGAVSISTTLMCDGETVIAVLENTGIPIADGAVRVEVILTGSGETIADTLPEMETGDTIDISGIDETYQIAIDGEITSTVDPAFCQGDGNADAGTSEPTNGDGSLDAEIVCNGNDEVVVLTNNGDPIAADSVVIEVELLDSGDFVADNLPALGTNETIELDSINENYRVMVNGESVLEVDVTFCENLTPQESGAGTIATPTSTPGEAAAPDTNAGTSGTDFLSLINAERARNGAGPVRFNDQLTVAAQRHSQDMVDRNYFDHIAPDPAPHGARPSNRVEAAGFQWTGVAENIAQGQQSEAEVFASWMDSQGHRENMLNPTYDQIGLARVGDMWTLVLATGSSSSTGASGNSTGTSNNNNNTTGTTASDFLSLINAERARNGAGPVRFNDQLTVAAQRHSQDMVDRNYFDHVAPDPAPHGARPSNRVEAAGFQWTGVAENIAQGQQSEAEVFTSWMNSQGHRENMLNPTYDQIGLARVGDMWTLVLAKGG